VSFDAILKLTVKVGTCCAPICWAPIPHGFGRCTSN
jgi:hypothetical protein